MADWILGGYTFPAAAMPSYESSMPEEQEDEHIEDTPIGANSTDATIITYAATPSIGAEGSEPFVLRGSELPAAGKAAILAMKRTTQVLKTPFDTTGKSVYLKKVRIKRWDGGNRASPAGAGETFLYWIWLVGR